ncbi:MAG: hypothetical protein RIR70_110 [Pseudomonadota bacterium]|jgi:chemotaxis protein histidine kinase CheA/CheY-like chemotaxis protein
MTTGNHSALPERTPDLAHPKNLAVLRHDSLEWARDEITDTLVRAHALLAQVPPALGEAGLCLRQSARAMEVIGQEAEAHVLRAAARVMADIEAGDGELSEYSLTWVRQSIDAIQAALDARSLGKSVCSLAWLPLYRQLCAMRGETVRIGDLFYPDLNLRPEAIKAQPVSLSDHLLAQQADFEHRRFERGMRAWLREPVSGSGLPDMRRAMQAIERGGRVPAARAFWWAAGALFEALIAGGLAITPELKQLVQAIERQLRHLLAGEARVPDALMREVLYHVAIAPALHPDIEAVQKAYDLEALLPPVAPHSAPRQSAHLAALGTALDRLLTGAPSASAEYAAAIESLTAEAGASQQMQLPRLLTLCKQAGEWLSLAAEAPHSERWPLLEELKAAQGVLARSLTDPSQHDAELARQSDLLAARLAQLEFDRMQAAPLAVLPALQKEREIEAACSRAECRERAASAFEALQSGLQEAMQQGAQRSALETLLLPVSQLDACLLELHDEPSRERLAAFAQGVNTLIEMGPEAQDAIFPNLVEAISGLAEALQALEQAETLPVPAAPLTEIVLAGGLSQPTLAARPTAPLPPLTEPAAILDHEDTIASTQGGQPPAAPSLPEKVQPASLAPASKEAFLAHAQALLAQIVAGLDHWRAVPDDTARAAALIDPVRAIKQGASALLLDSISDRAQGALVMLSAVPPSVVACEAALHELVREIGALLVAAHEDAVAEPAGAPTVGATDGAQALSGHDAELARSLEDATEMALAAGQMEGEIQLMQEGLAELRQRAQAMSAQVQALFERLPPEDFPHAHEALNMLAEGAQDLFLLQHSLSHRALRTERLLSSHRSRQRDLQQTLMDLRSLPIEALHQRIIASLDQASQRLGVAARPRFLGEPISLPPALIEGLGDMLEPLWLQMLRSTDGLAEIDIEIATEAHSLRLAIGSVPERTVIDLDALRDRLARLPITGAPEVTRVPRAGRGDTLRISVPLPSAAIPALVFAVAGSKAAVPAHQVVHQQMLEGSLLRELQEAGQFVWQGESYPLREFAELLGRPAPGLRRAQALLLHAGGLRLALLCEPGGTPRELVLKKTTPALARVPGLIGATVIDDNQPVLLIDPLTLAECKPRPTSDTDAAMLHMQPARLLLVDDSPSARQQARSVLMDAGFDVVLAPGGGQALDCLSEVSFSAALIDSDMSSMDGLELTRRLRADRSLAGLPIIMLSSRRTSAHREAAMMAGVDHYLYKPWQPAELIALLEKALAGAVTPGITQAVIRDADSRLEPV